MGESLIQVNAPFIVVVDIGSFPLFDQELNRAMQEINLLQRNADRRLYIIKFAVASVAGRPLIKCTRPDSSLVDIMHLSLSDYIHKQLSNHNTSASRIVIYSLNNMRGYLRKLDLFKYENVICCKSMRQLMAVCYEIEYPQDNIYYPDSIIEKLSLRIISLVNSGSYYYSDIKQQISGDFPNIDIKAAVRDVRFESNSFLRFNIWLNMFEKLKN